MEQFINGCPARIKVGAVTVYPKTYQAAVNHMGLTCSTLKTLSKDCDRAAEYLMKAYECDQAIKAIVEADESIEDFHPIYCKFIDTKYELRCMEAEFSI